MVKNVPKIAVIGCGYWGSKHVRVLFESPSAQVGLAVDFDPDRRDYINKTYPGVEVSSDLGDALNDDTIDGVVLATPISTHYSLASQALNAGKHVLVEKPLAETSREAENLIDLARSKELTLMVGHTFQYHPAVLYLRDLIASGELGKIHYIDCARLNLGLYQPDANVLWDLAPHDLSILTMLLDERPQAVSAWGNRHRLPTVEDVAYVNLKFPHDISAHVHVSWLDPCKVRRVTVVGSEGMVVFNDAQATEKVRLYDKRFVVDDSGDSYSEFQSTYHQGNVVIPPISGAEPLKLELEDFVASIETGRQPRANGEAGLRVVEILESASQSLANYAAPIKIERDAARFVIPLSNMEEIYAGDD